MRIRPVTRSDAAAWLGMRSQLWPGSRGDHLCEVERFFAGQAREPLAVLVAEEAGSRLVGFVELSIRPYAEGCSTDRVGFLEGWFVIPEARRQGVGRALVDAAEAWARSQGCSEFASAAESDNEPGSAAHRAVGFTDAGLVRCFSKLLSSRQKPEAESPQPTPMKLYNELASWWPVMSPPGEYEEEASFYRDALARASRKPIETLLELGSGGGNNASHMKAHYKEVVLVELSAAMIANSLALNPELEHHQGDMRAIRLGREFDAVFIHDAICYMTTESDLRNAIETAFAHCRPGGVALFAPDYVRELFETGTDHGGEDAGSRGMRWLEWREDPDPSDTTYLVDYAYLLRDRDGTIRVEHDRHLEGLFPRATWLRLFDEVGFTCRALPLDLSDLEPGKHEVFVCIRPEA